MRVLRTLARNLWTNGFTRALFQRDRRVDCKRSIILLCDHLDVHFSFLAQLTENDDPASRTRLTHHPVVVLISPHLHPAIRTIHLRGASFPRLHLSWLERYTDNVEVGSSTLPGTTPNKNCRCQYIIAMFNYSWGISSAG